MYFLRGNVRSNAKAKTAEVQGRKGAVNEDRVLHSLETTVHPISREATTYCSGLSVESAGLPVVIVSLASCLHFIRLF